jgi:DNA-binding beta-propeller fold protein YncE
VTANSRSGTISFVDGNSLQVVAEWKVGMTPTAIESAGPFLLLLDQSLHTLQVLRIQRQGVNQVIVQPVATAELPRYPTDLAVAADGRSIAITSLWSRMLTLLQLDNSGNVSEQQRISLPFAPRRVLFADARTIITADNFGGELCVVDAVTGNIIRQQSLHGHNIRGLAVNPQTNSLLVTCQTLDSRTFTTYERIFWACSCRTVCIPCRSPHFCGQQPRILSQPTLNPPPMPATAASIPIRNQNTTAPLRQHPNAIRSAHHPSVPATLVQW